MVPAILSMTKFHTGRLLLTSKFLRSWESSRIRQFTLRRKDRSCSLQTSIWATGPRPSESLVTGPSPSDASMVYETGQGRAYLAQASRTLIIVAVRERWRDQHPAWCKLRDTTASAFFFLTIPKLLRCSTRPHVATLHKGLIWRTASSSRMPWTRCNKYS